jgi:hypothetical protein
MASRPASSSSTTCSCRTSAFLAGEWAHAGFLAATYATHHRHSCIGARAGFGDLLIGAGVLMSEANGLDPGQHGHIRDAMVELIKIVEGFFACGVAASVYGFKDGSGNIQPDAVFANVGKLLLATQIYDMQRLAHYVSGGLVVALPGPDEDHNRRRPPVSPPCWRGGRTFRRRSDWKWRGCWRISPPPIRRAGTLSSASMAVVRPRR